MVHITQATAVAMINKIPQTSFHNISDILYQRPIYIFSKLEKARLLAIKQFFKNPEPFIEFHYQQVKKGQQNTNHLFPSSNPAYHLSLNCDALHADYWNILIPPQIQIRGEIVKNEFRNWFRENEWLYENKKELFMIKLSSRFNIRLSELQIIERINSGVTTVVNENLDSINLQISQLLRAAGKIYYSSQKNNVILKQYQHSTCLGYRDDILHSNRTGYSEKDVKTLLRNYNEKFKKPLKKLLTTYFKIKYNPELQFSGHLMERLGLSLCKYCAKNISSHKTDTTTPSL